MAFKNLLFVELDENIKMSRSIWDFRTLESIYSCCSKPIDFKGSLELENSSKMRHFIYRPLVKAFKSNEADTHIMLMYDIILNKNENI